jgi:hypothetical protein
VTGYLAVVAVEMSFPCRRNEPVRRLKRRIFFAGAVMVAKGPAFGGGSQKRPLSSGQPSAPRRGTKAHRNLVLVTS